MENGGAWLGFHVAAYNDRNSRWTWFKQFIGGGAFGVNNWPPLPAKLIVDDTESPDHARHPEDLCRPANEWYSWRPSPRLDQNVRVLLTLDPAQYPLGHQGPDHGERSGRAGGLDEHEVQDALHEHGPRRQGFHQSYAKQTVRERNSLAAGKKLIGAHDGVGDVVLIGPRNSAVSASILVRKPLLSLTVAWTKTCRVPQRFSATTCYRFRPSDCTTFSIQSCPTILRPEDRVVERASGLLVPRLLDGELLPPAHDLAGRRCPSGENCRLL